VEKGVEGSEVRCKERMFFHTIILTSVENLTEEKYYFGDSATIVHSGFFSDAAEKGMIESRSDPV
jgi:hypothetical protein